MRPRVERRHKTRLVVGRRLDKRPSRKQNARSCEPCVLTVRPDAPFQQVKETFGSKPVMRRLEHQYRRFRLALKLLLLPLQSSAQRSERKPFCVTATANGSVIESAAASD